MKRTPRSQHQRASSRSSSRDTPRSPAAAKAARRVEYSYHAPAPKHQAAKQLSEASKILAAHTKLILAQKFSSSVQSQLVQHIKQLTAAIEDVYKFLGSEENRPLALPPKPSDDYHRIVETVRSQTQSLKVRLDSIESGGQLKRVVEEQELKISALAKEKQLLSAHVTTLRRSMDEQSTVITHLKSLIAQAAVPKPANTEEYLKHQLEALDGEIEQLQESVNRAMSSTSK